MILVVNVAEASELAGTYLKVTALNIWTSYGFVEPKIIVCKSTRILTKTLYVKKEEENVQQKQEDKSS